MDTGNGKIRLDRFQEGQLCGARDRASLELPLTSNGCRVKDVAAESRLRLKVTALSAVELDRPTELRLAGNAPLNCGFGERGGP